MLLNGRCWPYLIIFYGGIACGFDSVPCVCGVFACVNWYPIIPAYIRQILYLVWLLRLYSTCANVLLFISSHLETDFERGWRNIQFMARSTSEYLHQDLSMEYHQQRRIFEWQRENACRRSWTLCLQVYCYFFFFFFCCCVHIVNWCRFHCGVR